MPSKSNFSSYDHTISFLEGLSNIAPKTKLSRNETPDLFVKRMQSFLDLIGNPEQSLKFIHIGGTAGKGSVSTLLHSMMVAQGYRVGLYTSPFATESIEKIKVGQLYIAPEELARIVDELKPTIDQAHVYGPYGRPSYFELFLAVALIYFQRQNCDWAILEVGIGGRYDATNVIPAPQLAAITTIDYDHVHILGKTLTKITRDKAGIIKPESAFFTTERRPHLVRILQEACQTAGASFHHVKPSNSYQLANQALATALARAAGVSDEALRAGTKLWRLPCRFETMQHKPHVILDGAHNVAKVRSTVENLARLGYRKLHLVLAIAHDKDAEAISSIIIPRADYMYATRFQINERKCTDPSLLSDYGKRFGQKSLSTTVHLDPYRALAAALAQATPDDVVLVTGSFFLAGELRKQWYSSEWVLRHRKSFKN